VLKFFSSKSFDHKDSLMPDPYSEEGYELMGAAFEVYNEIGYGMAEEV